MKKATFSLSFNDLRRAMGMPETVSIEHAGYDPKTDTVQFVVSGDGLPNSCEFHHGCHLNWLPLEYRQVDVFNGWAGHPDSPFTVRNDH